ncbi:kinase-like domain-containing protein [Scheffersomyces amazonensis]|uniref:kinase-like domain-containing protein n=1 Tax=Scheffersomyces amazonensis TaxID=1078765 RepID=UPI00315D4495
MTDSSVRITGAEELEVCEEVGRGAFGVVYRGLVKATGQEVAIKQIDLENEQTDIFEINKEIQIISECQLPQITRYLGCFVKSYQLWVIMEFVDGGSLFEMLRPGPIKDEGVISIILKEILIALDYLHHQGKIHRDLKSQNILLSKQGEVKLTDFGVSAQLSSSFSRRNTTVGTPYWMAPEVINNSDGHSFKADIWSLGCCAYEILTGKPPLQNRFPPMKALHRISSCRRDIDFINLIGLEELGISTTFEDFLIKCFVVNPRERSSASKLLNHKFITQYSKIPDKAKHMKKLITNKNLNDLDNHILKNQNFYVPTEIAKNQRKWNGDSDGEQKENRIEFDISSIEYDTPPPIPSSPSSSKKSTSEYEHGGGSKTLSVDSSESIDSKQEVLIKILKPEFNRILNKSFHKLESKNNLTTKQYDQLVKLNEEIDNLMIFSSSNESQKILVFQYLKYILKELCKESDTDSAKSILRKLVLPSSLSKPSISVDSSPINPPDQESVRVGKFDEIERSLFDAWINKTKERWTHS